MKRLTLLILALFALGLAVACEDDEGGSGAEAGDTVATVQDRGELLCGVKQTQPLFGFKEADGSVTGFDIEFCKAIAAATLGDANAVEYVDASDASTRFELLADQEIDVLIRTTTITASRDRELGVDFAQTTFYTGQGFAVRTDSGIDTTSDMGEAAICVQTGTTTEQNVADHFTDIGLEYSPLGGLSQDVADAFFTGRCDVLTADASDLASRIAVRDDAA
ncbi:MAG: transporter substrate-binding domain-containing protein, partial [Chloroflexi bacterium]|nr:transporter substrate-binding domain-containing protein [Chloroflexota bacterium]